MNFQPEKEIDDEDGATGWHTDNIANDHWEKRWRNGRNYG